MKVIGLDGKTYGWELLQKNHTDRYCSWGHERARELLKELFPLDKIYEEEGLPGTKPTLFADFIIPLRKLLIEVHGKQHYEWIPHFHTTRKDFLNAQACDRKKREWSERNNFSYIELPDTEEINGWRRRILEFGRSNV